MIIVYIKSNSFVKNADLKGNIVDFVFESFTNKEGIVEVKDLYLEKGFKKVELDNKYFDCCFEDFNEDLTFSIDKYNARKQKENEAKYEDLIVSKIRKKYSVNQELAILRQRDTKPEEYQIYFDYVEQCKAEAKSEVLNDNNTIN